MKPSTATARCLLPLCLALGCTALTARAQDHWQFEITPYAWLKGVKGESGGTKVDLDFFEDILDRIDSAYAVSVSADKGRWSFFGSLEYNKISDNARLSRTIDVPLPPTGETIPVELGNRVEISLEQTYMDFGAGYDVLQSATVDLQVIGGARYFDNETAISLRGLTVTGPGGNQITLDGRRIEVGDDWWTPYLGGRMIAQVGERWRLRMRGDLGYADSDNGYWLLEALLDYRLNDWGAIQFGYRYLDIDFDNDSGSDPFDYKMEESGAIIGFIFHL